MTSLVRGLGGGAGFGEFSVARTDNGSTAFIDLRSVFGNQGINFFGQYYTGLYLNNNGTVTFNAADSSFSPSPLTGTTSNPIIAAYWADVDTSGGAVTPTPGGSSRGSNLVWYDLDTVDHTFTATWDDVGYSGSHTDKLNAFQLSIHKLNTVGDFEIAFRYENIDWTTGDASGGSGGLGGTPARAGYSSGNGTDYFELPQSGNQTALLDMENASNVGTPGTFVFDVRNGHPKAEISIGDISFVEGSGSFRHVDIPVTLNAPYPYSVVSVHYEVFPGTAKSPDYNAGEGEGWLYFDPGETQKNIKIVSITGDTLLEGDETFKIVLSDPSDNVSIVDDAGIITIIDDEHAGDVAALSISPPSDPASPELDSPVARVFKISRTGDLNSAVNVDWAVTGSEVDGADFVDGVLPFGTVSFAPGETLKSVYIYVAGDSIAEEDEGFSVELSNPSADAVIDTASAHTTLLNDDASVSITATSAVKAEGQGGNTRFTFDVVRTGYLDHTSDRVLWTLTGANVDASDFDQPLSGSVSFSSGQTLKVITIDVRGDTVIEADETFTVTLYNPTAGVSIGTASASSTIRNDDSSLSIAATDADKVEGRSGTTLFTFTVTRTGDLTSAVSAKWAVSGAAVDGADFVGGVEPSGTVSFAAGEISKVITVKVAGDRVQEPNETFSVELYDPSTGTTIGTAATTGTIRNDDATISIAATSADKAEGQSGITPFTFTVTRTGDTTSAVSAQWAVVGHGADGADFVGGVLPSGTVSFAAGQTSKVITVKVVGDTLPELDEGFSVRLSVPSIGAILGTAQANGTIRTDDNANTLFWSGPNTTLAADKRNLVLLGTADVDGTGNALDNQLVGNSGKNLLRGSGGDDILSGQGDRDVLNGGGGIDTADYSEKIDPVSVTLAGAENATVWVNGLAEDRIRNMENVKGGWDKDSLTGDDKANTLDGGAGNDRLSGGDGRDLLIGGTGRDKLRGGADADIFRFGSGDSTLASFDTITDFRTGVDKIDLDIFAGTPSASAYSELAVASDTASDLFNAAITQMTSTSAQAVFVAGNTDGYLVWQQNTGGGPSYYATELKGRNSLSDFGASDLT